MELSSLIEKQIKTAKAFCKANKKLVRRTATHFGAGALALTIAIGSTSSAIFSAKADRNDSKDAFVANEQSVVTTTTAQPQQTVYATQAWWKAGIEEYDFVEFTSAQLDYAETEEESATQEPFPNISFTVSKPESQGSYKSSAIPSHKTYATRSIANEYYTVKSLTAGGRVSGNGFDMVCKILNGEMGPSFSEEALKAQAVAIYTYLRYCDANNLMPVVATRGNYNDKIKNAVKAVEGQVLTYNGGLVNAVFCASTAGCTTSSQSVWGGRLDYLQGVACEYDYLDPNYGVKRQFTASELKRIIERKTDIRLSNSDVENWFEIVSCTNGKYVGDIKIGGQTHARVGGRTVKLTGAVLRASILGNSTLRSTAFDISYKDGIFTFTTYGYGHGVGMSQWGAHLMSTEGGYKYDQILLHYYDGSKLSCSGVNSVAEDRFGDDDVSDKQEAVPGDKPEEKPESDKSPATSQTATVTTTSTAVQTTTTTTSQEATTTTTTTASETAPAVTTAPELTSPVTQTTSVQTTVASASPAPAVSE